MTIHDVAVVDTNIIAALHLYDPEELPNVFLITAITLGELSFGPHATDDPVKRARRVAVLQHVEATFDPLPYDQGAARLYGQICAAVRAAGREPRKRAADLMIAATAASNELPLYTANPDDFKGIDSLVEVVGVRGCSNNL
ncbi:MAG TPA: type II toxin-antitoxin system VapC family toxin [Pseudonocardiaceae bacterium]